MMISKNLKDFINISEDDVAKKWCDEKLRNICKPCWELKYCPYGPLVEDFPGPPIDRKSYIEHLEYLKNCLSTGFYGEGELKRPLDDFRRELFEIEIKEDSSEYIVDEISEFEQRANCTEFGHFCPAYFVSESDTETKEQRKLSRNISNATLIRVVRRDNNTCQICKKILIDREIEIDHIIPFSRGGVSEEHNLRVTCLECNRRKSNKLDFLHDK
ncbi:HNH endonuclease signature motif containing protein [Clostridium sp. E02]|uniref:HNH endonuclease n=1 Tax=Clostridium sp. E02 TaxID=2487134 RepID=UPI000F53DBFC|nr:HNH endonuclease signature motif containing protein [Clostridium sp. E02]